MEDYFVKINRAAPFYTYSMEEIYRIFPVKVFQKSYHKYKDEKIKKNMLEILDCIIQMYMLVYNKKCITCKNYGNYTCKNNTKFIHCYRHKTSKMVRLNLEDNLPFVTDGKLTISYCPCMDAVVKYCDLTMNPCTSTDDKINYRILSRCYACLATYMDDAPEGVYPKSYKEIATTVSRPEIIVNPKYAEFKISKKFKEKRDGWIKLHNENKLFK